jgi:lipopolysaccharide export system permease protein
MVQVISAKELYQPNNEGGPQPSLVFLEGYLYEFPEEGQGGHIFGFRESTVSLEGKETPPVKYRVRSATTGQLSLSASPPDVAEWQWRLASPFSAVLLALLAVPLSRTAPRQGKYAKIVVGVVLYALYYNLSATAKSWVETGVSPPMPGIWWVPGLLTLVVIGLLWPQIRDLFRHSARRGHAV